MSELTKLFEYIITEDYKHITQDFMKRCQDEYDSQKEQGTYPCLEYFLVYSKNKKWKSAIDIVPRAQAEYNTLLRRKPKEQYTDRAQPDKTVADKPPVEPPPDYEDQRPQHTETRSGDRENTNENKCNSSDLAHLQHSKEAGHKMKHNNPNIADLSDTNRPTKIAERYSELYDNQWTEAYEVLMKNLHNEETTIKCLLQIVQEAFKYCKEESEKQITSMQSGFQNILRGVKPKKDTNGNTKSNESDTSLLVQYRKDIAELALADLQQTFWANPDLLHKICRSFNLPNKPSENGPVAKYAWRCVELTWWMCVQSPPICMHDCDDKLQKFESSLYRAYTKSGKELAFFVWPALYLHEGGPVLMKGVAQCR